MDMASNTKNNLHTADQRWSRRSFLSTTVAMGLGTVLSPILAKAFYFPSDDLDAIVRRTIGIDTHNHIDVPLIQTELPGPSVPLAASLTASGLSAICMTFAVDYVRLTYEGQAYERFLTGLDAMDRVLTDNNMSRSLNLGDIQMAHKAGRPTVIQSVEGGHFLEGKIERMQVAYDRGLRHLGLLHDHDASTPLGDIFTESPRWGGLTAFGAAAIKECERLGILVDLSHCDDNTVNGALKIAQKPVIISHTGLNTRLGDDPNMARMMRPRLISAELAKRVAGAGGVIGVWTHLASDPAQMAGNIQAMVDVAGIDHVAIGTDTKLTPAYQSPNKEGSWWGAPEKDAKKESTKKEEAKKENQAALGRQAPHGEPPTTNSLWSTQSSDKGFYYKIVNGLLKAGYKQRDIAKIGGGNYLRVFDRATRKG
jgi:microsomal dipeptidase-like Zn-dependent dipeptidase